MFHQQFVHSLYMVVTVLGKAPNLLNDLFKHVLSPSQQRLYLLLPNK